MKVATFRTAVMVMAETHNTSVFPDGRVNQFSLTADPGPDTTAAALDLGYGLDWRRFITEHDLTHHFVADRLGRGYSYAIHDAPAVALHDAPSEVKEDEHLTNALLALINIGRPDPYAALHWRFGYGLPSAARDLAQLLNDTCGPMPRAVATM